MLLLTTTLDCHRLKPMAFLCRSQLWEYSQAKAEVAYHLGFPLMRGKPKNRWFHNVPNGKSQFKLDDLEVPPWLRKPPMCLMVYHGSSLGNSQLCSILGSSIKSIFSRRVERRRKSSTSWKMFKMPGCLTKVKFRAWVKGGNPRKMHQYGELWMVEIIVTNQ